MLALALDDPDCLGFSRKAAERRLGDGRGDVRLHARVHAVLPGVEAAVVLDDRAVVAGAKLASDGRGGHVAHCGWQAASSQHIVVTALIVKYDQCTYKPHLPVRG